MHRAFLASIGLFFICFNVAFAAPNAEEINAIVNYKETGTVPILYKFVLTNEVKDLVPVDNVKELTAGTKGVVWLKFLVPNEAENTNFAIVIKRGALPIKTKEVSLVNKNKGGSYGYRTWVSKKYEKAGKYTAEVYYKDQIIKSLSFSVN